MILSNCFSVDYSPHGRPGEQHSFILRPVSQAWLTGKQPAVEDGTPRYRSSQDGQGIGNIKTRRGSNHESDCGEYAILVSCHCSHTGKPYFSIVEYF